MEDKLPELEKVLGKENVSVRIVDGLGHGFGIGNETKVKNWFRGSSHLLGSPQIGTDKNLFKEDFIMSRNLKELIRQMTLEEKAGLCSGADFWNTMGIERLGIPSVMMTDGPHGLRKQEGAADHLGLNKV